MSGMYQSSDSEDMENAHNFQQHHRSQERLSDDDECQQDIDLTIIGNSIRNLPIKRCWDENISRVEELRSAEELIDRLLEITHKVVILALTPNNQLPIVSFFHQIGESDVYKNLNFMQLESSVLAKKMQQQHLMHDRVTFVFYLRAQQLAELHNPSNLELLTMVKSADQLVSKHFLIEKDDVKLSDTMHSAGSETNATERTQFDSPLNTTVKDSFKLATDNAYDQNVFEEAQNNEQRDDDDPRTTAVPIYEEKKLAFEEEQEADERFNKLLQEYEREFLNGEDVQSLAIGSQAPSMNTITSSVEVQANDSVGALSNDGMSTPSNLSKQRSILLNSDDSQYAEDSYEPLSSDLIVTTEETQILEELLKETNERAKSALEVYPEIQVIVRGFCRLARQLVAAKRQLLVCEPSQSTNNNALFNTVVSELAAFKLLSNDELLFLQTLKNKNYNLIESALQAYASNKNLSQLVDKFRDIAHMLYAPGNDVDNQSHDEISLHVDPLVEKQSSASSNSHYQNNTNVTSSENEASATLNSARNRLDNLRDEEEVQSHALTAARGKLREIIQEMLQLLNRNELLTTEEYTALLLHLEQPDSLLNRVFREFTDDHDPQKLLLALKAIVSNESRNKPSENLRVVDDSYLNAPKVDSAGKPSLDQAELQRMEEHIFSLLPSDALTAAQSASLRKLIRDLDASLLSSYHSLLSAVISASEVVSPPSSEFARVSDEEQLKALLAYKEAISAFVLTILDRVGASRSGSEAHNGRDDKPSSLQTTGQNRMSMSTNASEIKDTDLARDDDGESALISTLTGLGAKILSYFNSKDFLSDAQAAFLKELLAQGDKDIVQAFLVAVDDEDWPNLLRSLFCILKLHANASRDHTHDAMPVNQMSQVDRFGDDDEEARTAECHVEDNSDFFGSTIADEFYSVLQALAQEHLLTVDQVQCLLRKFDSNDLELLAALKQWASEGDVAALQHTLERIAG